MILVTGGTGFLGAHLIRFLLQHQYAVRAIYRTEAAIPADLRDQVQWVACDVLDILGLDDAMQGVDYVFHCAAVVSFSAKDRRMMYNINVTGTANVIHAALTAGVKKMIHVSSIAALGRTEENIVITEKTTWQDSNLNSFYAQTKHLAELEVWRGIEEGLTAVIVNPSVIIGETDWNKGTGRFFKTMRKGLRYYPTGSNGFVSVHDVVQCMYLLMRSEVTNDVFILNGDNISYKQFFTIVTGTLGVPGPQFQLSPALVKLVRRVATMWSMLTLREPFLTRETATTVNHNYTYSNDKFIRQFNFSFEKAEVFIGRTAAHYARALRGHS